MNFLISVVLFGCLFIGSVSSQVVMFTSSLEATDREYVCPGEVVTYVCTGSGNIIELLVQSPQISLFERVLFKFFDRAGKTVIKNGITMTLISINPFVVNMTVENTSLTGLTISCLIYFEFPRMERKHVLSERPTDIGINSNVTYIRCNFSVFINLTENAGNFDLSYYTVNLLANNFQVSSVNISAEQMEFPTYTSAGSFGNGSTPAVVLPLILPEGTDTDVIKINAVIRTTSKCGQTSDGFLTETVTVRNQRSGGVAVQYTFFVLVLVVAVAIMETI